MLILLFDTVSLIRDFVVLLFCLSKAVYISIHKLIVRHNVCVGQVPVLCYKYYLDLLTTICVIIRIVIRFNCLK